MNETPSDRPRRQAAAHPLLGPRLEADRWTWRGGSAGARVLFLGRADGASPAETPTPEAERERALSSPDAEWRAASWLEQVHSADVLEAEPGCSGRGDALITARPGLALSIVTADCVPVLLSTGRHVAAVHAGWRGIAARVVAAAVQRLQAAERSSGPPPPPTAEWCAWVGPAIGACCYEVGSEVADQVVAASTADAACRGPAGKPHLDLPRAVLAQLATVGVGTVRPILWCTQCEGRYLHSYRREGPGAGRNRALIWLS